MYIDIKLQARECVWPSNNPSTIRDTRDCPYTYLLVARRLVQTLLTHRTVPLSSAGEYAIVAQADITNVRDSVITGSVAASPIAGTAMTGFGFTRDASSEFSMFDPMTGKAYTGNDSEPTPTLLTKAVQDMLCRCPFSRVRREPRTG